MSWIANSFLELLKVLAEQNFPPTKTSHVLYIYSSLLYQSQKQCRFIRTLSPTAPLRPEPGWNTPNHLNMTLLYTSQWAFNKINQVLFNSLAVRLSSFAASLRNPQYRIFTEIHRSQFTLLNRFLLQLWTLLDENGWKNSDTFDGSLPNGSLSIDPNSTLPDGLTDAWTPLTSQTYLSPGWGEISGPVPSSVVDTYKNELNDFWNMITDRTNEYADVLRISQNLTDEQKVISEFWAGGPGSVTPPGIWNLFLIGYLQQNRVNLQSTVRLFYAMNSALYQAGIIAWWAKRDKMQARPIQKVRELFTNDVVESSYQGTTTGSLWKPFQKNSFLTPPFPDFISGHSTFSSAAATILYELIGKNPNEMKCKLTPEMLNLISPIFSNRCVSYAVDIHCIPVYPETMEAEATSPSKLIHLVSNTWDDLALMAGVSRIYGGIHIESSNYPGYVIGKEIGHYISQNI